MRQKKRLSFPMVNFPFLDGAVLLASSYGVCISPLLRFAIICNNVSDFNDHNLVITENFYTKDTAFINIITAIKVLYINTKMYNFTCSRQNTSRIHTCQCLVYLDISFSQGKFNMQLYDKKDNFSFPIVNFRFLDI